MKDSLGAKHQRAMKDSMCAKPQRATSDVIKSKTSHFKNSEDIFSIGCTLEDFILLYSYLLGTFDEINFNENISFFNDEFLIPRSKVSQCSSNDDFFPHVPAHDLLSTNNITIPDTVSPTDSPILQVSNSPDESLVFKIVDDHPVHNIHDDSESAKDFEPAEFQNTILNEPNSEIEPSPSNISPSAQARVTTRSRIRDSEAASVHECLYVNFLSEIETKKLIEALEEMDHCNARRAESL
ncbi:hypothetical protein Tco_1261451 [Tanacetum coccineum]